MHELSICENIIDAIEAEMQEQLPQVREVHLEVGILSCVQPLVLEHIYTCMTGTGPLQHSTLKIEQVEVLAACRECRQQFKVEDSIFVCPDCGSPSSDILKGRELKIVRIIVEEQQHEEINE
ncbi:hydrogenase maturation nickel metallochaperone HypA/HybF [Pontibacter sp. MBLB2868]|uniref:hydrogenase maturation nickel metallochaperone HypA/HybF n=1 Tax=Pontibacter sp. MBLB2868 TaxID=3451555 RepID=UPI003F74F6BE